MIRSYQDLIAWQRGMELVEAAYRVARNLPSNERYGLGSQIQRAAVSIPANIAEGHGQVHLGDYIYHLSIALGSVDEIETLLLLASRLQNPDSGMVDNAKDWVMKQAASSRL